MPAMRPLPFWPATGRHTPVRCARGLNPFAPGKMSNMRHPKINSRTIFNLVPVFILMAHWYNPPTPVTPCNNYCMANLLDKYVHVGYQNIFHKHPMKTNNIKRGKPSTIIPPHDKCFTGCISLTFYFIATVYRCSTFCHVYYRYIKVNDGCEQPFFKQIDLTFVRVLSRLESNNHLPIWHMYIYLIV